MAPAETIAIEIMIEPGEPPSGTVRGNGQETETRFSGWVELMAAITAIRISTSPKRASP